MVQNRRSDPVDTVFVGGTVMDAGGRYRPGTGIAVSDGVIVAVATEERLPPADRTVDIDGKLLTPGIVDDHIHHRVPGQEYKEDWETATCAAAAGGVTTVVGMPNTDPIIDRMDVVETTFEAAGADAHVDYQLHVVVTSDNLDRLEALADAGIAGFKVFLGRTVGGIEAPNDGELLDAMETVADLGKRLGFHEENDEIRHHREWQYRDEDKTAAIWHNRSRPPIAEAEAVSRVCLFADHTGCPVHMFHLSSGSAAQRLAEWREKGVDATSETCPHYLWFTEDIVEKRGAQARVQPPLRSKDERDRLWAVGMDGGAVDCIATDHAPHTDAEKALEDPDQTVWETSGGFVGVETQVPAMLTFVDEGRLSLRRWVAMHTKRPAEIWGMYPQKGSLAVGTDADFTVVDPDERWTLDRETLHSKNTPTVWDDASFVGAVEMTVLRGEVVYDGDRVIGEPGDGRRAETDTVSG